MRTLRWLAFGMFMLGLAAGPALAGVEAGKPTVPPTVQCKPKAASGVVVTGVSQIQQDIVNKREKARQRKAEMLQVREQTIAAEEEQAKALAAGQAK